MTDNFQPIGWSAVSAEIEPVANSFASEPLDIRKTNMVFTTTNATNLRNLT